MASLVQIFGISGGIGGIDIDATIREQLHSHAGELDPALPDLLRMRTPVLTGALQSDYVTQTFPDVSDNNLFWVYAGGTEQLNQWGRLYVQYVEGPPMGASTWTNPPRHIFINTADTDGRVLVEVWAATQCMIALGRAAAGLGVPI